MVALNIPTRSGAGRYAFQNTTRLLNAYAEPQGADGKGPVAVLPCYGMTSFSEVTDTPCRGMIYLEDLDLIYTVHSGSVYSVNSSGTKTRLGVVPGQDPVQITRNRKATPQVIIRCDAGVYFLENSVVAKIVDDDLGTVVTTDTFSGITLYGYANGEFSVSALNECTDINALDFAEAEQSPDGLKRIIVDRREVLLMGTRTIEPWVPSNNPDFPFEPLAGASIRKGLLAADSPAFLDTTLMFVGDDSIVYRLNGYNPVRISDNDVEQLIEDDDSPEDIIGFAWSQGGHAFYTLTGTDWTETYDARTQRWHRRESYQQTSWRARYAVEAWGKVIVGDSLTGELYELSKSNYTEDGNYLIYGADFPTAHNFPNGGVIDSLYFDMLQGQGVLSSSADGYNPKVMITVSKDGGNTFGAERQLSMGLRGNYRKNMKPRRFGWYGPQGFTVRLRISDPVGRGLVNAAANVRPARK